MWKLYNRIIYYFIVIVIFYCLFSHCLDSLFPILKLIILNWRQEMVELFPRVEFHVPADTHYYSVSVDSNGWFQ
jgi:hypothetical protein